MPGDDPDLPLAEALRAGDERALDALIGRHGEALFRFVLRYLANEADAREVAQETFVRAYFHIGEYRSRPGARFSTWLHRIAINLCRDRARSRAFRQARRTESLSAPRPGEEENHERDVVSSAGDPAEDLLRRERAEALREEIGALPPALKEPFLLAALEGLSHIETGERLGLTAKAVEGKVRRAREILMRRLARRGF